MAGKDIKKKTIKKVVEKVVKPKKSASTKSPITKIVKEKTPTAIKDKKVINISEKESLTKIKKTAVVEAAPVSIPKPIAAKPEAAKVVVKPVTKPVVKTAVKKIKNLNDHVMEEDGEETAIEASKYLNPEAVETEVEIKPVANIPAERHETTLPMNYSDDRIVLMVRDPNWCYVYWDLSVGLMEAKAKNIHEKYDLVIRVYDVTDVSFDGNNSHKFVDIQVNGEAGNWYINVWETNRSYVVDIGYKTASGKFILLARSNAIIAPGDEISQHTDEEWMVVDEDFEELFRLSSGGKTPHSAIGSEGLNDRLSSDLSSGSVSSFSSPAGGGGIPVKKRGFFLNVDTELILYGNTESDADLTVKGEKVDLKEDGSFSLRFHLPNGVNYLPVEAVSSDKAEKIIIKISVERKTE